MVPKYILVTALVLFLIGMYSYECTETDIVTIDASKQSEKIRHDSGKNTKHRKNNKRRENSATHEKRKRGKNKRVEKLPASDVIESEPADCRSMEECAVYFNKSDPLRDAILFNEEEPSNHPCLIQGELKASSNWFGYLANGTLAANGARFYYRIIYPEEKCCIKLLLYLEEQVSAMRAHMNCLQRQSIIATNPKQIITLSPSVESSGCTTNHTINGQKMIECNSGRILRSSYDQHWHFAASSCGSPTGLSMEYNLVMYGMRSECPDLMTDSAVVTGDFPGSLKLLILPSLLAIFHAIDVHRLSFFFRSVLT